MDAALFTGLAQIFGGWEIILILAIVLILFAAKKLPDIAEGLGKGIDEFRKATNDVREEIGEATDESEQEGRLEDGASSTRGFFVLWIAQGFGLGRIPFGPGTIGSLVGLLWFFLLLATGNFWLYVAGMALGFALSVWACGVAERILNRTDPPSIVLDEIIAMPICFASWMAVVWVRQGILPGMEYFFSASSWPWTIGVFAAFRLFDVVKPWPVRQSQSLPGGWGVTVDDLLAAVYVNVATLLVMALHQLPIA